MSRGVNSCIEIIGRCIEEKLLIHQWGGVGKDGIFGTNFIRRAAIIQSGFTHESLFITLILSFIKKSTWNPSLQRVTCAPIIPSEGGMSIFPEKISFPLRDTTMIPRLTDRVWTNWKWFQLFSFRPWSISTESSFPLIITWIWSVVLITTTSRSTPSEGEYFGDCIRSSTQRPLPAETGQREASLTVIENTDFVEG